MSPVPEIYRKRSPAIISFDWSDTVAGVGYIDFWGVVQDNGANFLSVNNIGSGTGYLDTGNKSYDADYDFDITVVKPFNVAAADAFIDFVYDHDTGGSPANVTLNVTIYHVDADNTETALSTFEIVNDTASSAETIVRVSRKMAISSKKHFKKGDKIRLSLDFTRVNSTYTLYHDSDTTITDNDGRTVTTHIKLSLPIDAKI